ncbi:MAG: VOC family protein [Candidatus Acidiferrales bacterium]
MRLRPHLNFDGKCEAAFKFYENCLGGKITFMMTYGDSPMAAQTQPDWQKKIIHATLAVGDQVLTGADAPPGYYQKPQGFSVTLNVSDAAEADRIFNALSEKGVVQMPVQETFWALRFGMFVDQFGTPWMINCGKPQA